MVACLILPVSPLQVTKAVRVLMADPYAVSTITFPVALGGARHPSHAERLRDNILIQVCLALGIVACCCATAEESRFVALQGYRVVAAPNTSLDACGLSSFHSVASVFCL